MKPAMRDISDISKQRGIWLRCFLELVDLYWCSSVLKGHGFSESYGLQVKGTGFRWRVRASGGGYGLQVEGMGFR